MTDLNWIAAIATPAGRGGVGIVRISGTQLSDLIYGFVDTIPKPRYATLTTFFDADGDSIDQGLLLYFPAPHSFTGEDVVELHGHGGPIVLQRLLRRCMTLGARLAEPGEFTRRAFMNQKIDLAQAEGVADLIAASSEQAARCAMRSLSGVFSEKINGLVSQIITLRIEIESALDFPEEATIVQNEAMVYQEKINHLYTELIALTQGATQGRLLREGLQVALIGAPNVGKSSLLNALAGQDAALVSEIAGTTRDNVPIDLHLNGVPLHIIDTAGLRETVDVVERMGIARTWAAARRVDVICLVVDHRNGVTPEDSQLLKQLPNVPVIILHNKVDLAKVSPYEDTHGIHVSALTGDGIPLLKNALLKAAGWQTSEGVFLARERHLHALACTKMHLEAAKENFYEIELCAEALRLAQNALATITGEFNADDLLGEIFSRFCIGK